MATRPSLLPQWASNLVNVVAPPLARKISGFAPGEEPPAGWVNWLWNLGYKWNEYLRDVLDETAVALGGTNATDLPTQIASGLHDFQWFSVEPINANIGSASYSGAALTIGDVETATYRIPMDAGEVLRAVDMRCKDLADVSLTLSLSAKQDDNDDASFAGGLDTSDQSGTYQTVIVDLTGSEYTVPDGTWNLFASITRGGIGTGDVFVSKLRVLKAKTASNV